MLRLSIAAVLTLIAFASNSVLNRMAVAGGHISVGDFAIYRVAAGAVTLIVISLILGRASCFLIRTDQEKLTFSLHCYNLSIENHFSVILNCIRYMIKVYSHLGDTQVIYPIYHFIVFLPLC